MSRLADFLIRSAGVDPESARTISRAEVIKYETLGILVCCTASFAIISCSFALSFIFEDNYTLAAPIALLWGLTIYALDRFFLTTMVHKSGLVRIMVGLPRLLAALVIGFLISHPIKLEVFGDNIERRIAQMRLDETQRLTKLEREEIRELREQVLPSLTENPSAKSLADLQLQKSNLEGEIALTTERVVHERTLAEAETDGDLVDFDGEITSGQSGCGPRCKRHLRQMQMHSASLEQLKQRLDTLDNQILDIESNSEMLFGNLAEVSLLNLVGEVTARLTEERASVTDRIPDDYVGRTRVFGELTESDETLRMIAFAFIAIFVIIESLPVFVKMVSGMGKYEENLIALELDAIRRNKQELRTSAALEKERAELMAGLESIKSKIVEKELAGDTSEYSLERFHQVRKQLLDDSP
ncbi:MAG: DUF4407 domain-containing protein [Pseudomonadales bacterium]|nr:DUF4407 domain-containing protein [Pseudomonadales bacterium]